MKYLNTLVGSNFIFHYFNWSVKLIEIILLICGVSSGWFPKQTFSIPVLWCSPVLCLGVWEGCLSTFAQL